MRIVRGIEVVPRIVVVVGVVRRLVVVEVVPAISLGSPWETFVRTWR
jgi:hypothetical protein